MKSFDHFCWPNEKQTMKLSNTILALSLLCLLFFSNCKKKTTTPEPSKTKTEMLTNSNWVILKATFNPPIVTTIATQTFTFKELFEIPLIQECQKDNIIIFKTDSTMTIDNGGKLCSATEAQTVKDGKWKFINNETQIEITKSAYFSLINSDKVILDQITVSGSEMTGVTDYEFVNPQTSVKTISKVTFVFTK